MNCTSVKVIYIILFLFLPNRIFAQDSLYLVGTLQGEDIQNPISNINKLGDINGDGFDDFITCVPKSNYCNIFFGNDSLDFIPDVILKGPSDIKIYEYGMFLGSVGDVNGDGYDDFVIHGKNFYSSFFRGTIFLYLGNEVVDTIPDFIFNDYFIQDVLGSSISSGDVNGDGYNDFIVGNPYNWTDGIGRAYLFFGNENINNLDFITFKGQLAHDFFGDNVSLDGDINGDGFDDLLISSPNINGNSNTNSKIYIYYGNTTISDIADTILNYTTQYADISAIYIPDFNGDDFDDFYIKTENILLFGANNFSSANYLMFSSDEELDNFGSIAGMAGDINGDGFDDLILGATNHKNFNGVMVGGAYIFLGSSHPNSTPDFFLEGETKWSHFGRKVGSLGDLNGDGFDEIYVLADGYPDSESPLGKVYIYSMKKFLVSVEEEKQTKVHYNFNLFQNYPNPFNPSTIIKYSIPQISSVKLSIYNMMGQLVKTLVNETQVPGSYNVEWNGTNEDNYKVSSGIYFYRLESGNFTQSNKMILLK